MSTEPETPRDENAREAMQQIGHAVDENLPQGWGFVVMAFPFGIQDGRLNYISNATREDVLKVMVEFIAKSRDDHDFYGKHV